MRLRYRAKFQTLEGWFRYGPAFHSEDLATVFAIEYANRYTRVIDFDVVPA